MGQLAGDGIPGRNGGITKMVFHLTLVQGFGIRRWEASTVLRRADHRFGWSRPPLHAWGTQGCRGAAYIDLGRQPSSVDDVAAHLAYPDHTWAPGENSRPGKQLLGSAK